MILKSQIEKDWNFWLNHSKELKPSSQKNNLDNYFFIFNSFTNEIDFVSQSVEKILGINKSEFTFFNLIANIHLDDYKYVLDCERQSLEFSNSLYFNDNFRFTTTYSYRIKNSNGNYIKIRQEYHALEINENGNMSKSLVMHMRIEDDAIKDENDFKIIDRLQNRIVNKNNIYNLTKRELEILELIQQGLKSSEISEILYLSKYTVDTHRKNILAKTKTTSFFELINILVP